MNSAMNQDGLWDWNLVTNRVHFSPRWIALMGAAEHDVSNGPNEWLLRIHPDDVAQVTRELDAVRQDGRRAFEFRHRMRHKDGSYRWMACRGAVVRDDEGRATRLTGSHVDVTADTVADRVTGLPSRALLADRIARALDRDSRFGNLPFAVLMVGLDRPPSPEQGTDAADGPLLIAMARRLETCLRLGVETGPARRHDDLVARLEGDRFAILLEGLSEIDESRAVADRIVADLQRPFAIGSRQVYASASVGIAVSVTGYVSTDALLRDADTALHRARVLGGARSEAFDTAVLQSAQTTVRLEQDMAGALERGEFAVVYQPIVSLASLQISGFEALVRWHHPAAGVIAPADFIPIAERTGLIVPLGLWVLRQACEQLMTWRNTLPEASQLWMSVNLSSVQLECETLVDDIRAVLAEWDVDPRAVVLELTEAVACKNPGAVQTVLMRLRALGLRISIDDFGTGYSSLSYLRQFPVDALKIDRSFVRGISQHAENVAIVGTVTSMARQLGLHVVAEGVESEDEVSLLHSLRCEFGQGYLFSRPLDREAAATLLRAGVPHSRHDEAAMAATSVERSDPSKMTTGPGVLVMRWAPIAAVVALVLATAGVANWFVVTSRVGVENAVSPAPLDDGAQAPRDRPPVEAITLEKDTTTPAVPSESTAFAAASPPAERPQAESRLLRVQHLHRLGSCSGRLRVSRQGLTFTPEANASDHAFVLGHGAFLASVDERTLAIRSHQKIYRFKVTELERGTAPGAPLQSFLKAIALFR